MRQSGKHPVKTSAEGGIDHIIQRKFFPNTDRGVFVDVGAGRPDYLSFSALFRASGWRVISIEPNPAFCEEYIAAGYEVLEYACGDRDEDDVDCSVVDPHGATYAGGHVSYESFSLLSIGDCYRSLRRNLDITTIKVHVRKLDTTLEMRGPRSTTHRHLVTRR